jgi:hypothetical protein
MEQGPSLSLAIRWLAEDGGIDPRELARRAGMTLPPVTRLLTKPNDALKTWMAMAAGLQVRIRVISDQRELTIPVPKIPADRRDHELANWRKRRLSANRAQVAHQTHLDQPEIAETATEYLEAAEGRLAGSLTAAQKRLAGTGVQATATNLRAALRLIAEQAEVNAEDVSLLSGVSLDSAQGLLGAAAAGWLATPHRLVTALGAKIVILPAGGGSITVAPYAMPPAEPSEPRTGASSISIEDIIARAERHESGAEIARAAGISRQRVHSILKRARSLNA